MSKFINTTQKVIIDSLVDGFKESLKNPYYLHADKPGTLVAYYNIDKKKSTLDEALKIEYSALGKDSAFVYNKINNLLLHGIEKIVVSLENGEWGLEADSITGEAIILPNTIIPIANDYFVINHIDKPIMFKVTSVTTDTIENGANFYKIEYKLDQLTNEVIEKQVDEEFEMIVGNVGTEFKSIVRSNDYKYIEKVELIVDRLKEYYRNLFYAPGVQTFVCTQKGKNLYDPYLIEFLIRNKILKDNSNYIHITHQTFIPQTFAIDYDRTFFRFVELPDLKRRNHKVNSQASLIDEYLSIMSFSIQDYYQIKYVDTNDLVDQYAYIINNFDKELVERVYDTNQYKEEDYRNIIIKYFNNIDITADDIFTLELIDYYPTLELFYNIPIILYIINNGIEKILRTTR